MQDTRLVTACYCHGSRRSVCGHRRYPGSAVLFCLAMGDRRCQCTYADSLIFCLSLSRQFAIRTTIRHHNVMRRDDVIQQVAAAVGDQHSVDLQHYDWLILVEIYRVRRFPSGAPDRGEDGPKKAGADLIGCMTECVWDERRGSGFRATETIQSGGTV